jgi:hypothetical protein
MVLFKTLVKEIEEIIKEVREVIEVRKVELREVEVR